MASVLICEDNPDIRRALVMILHRAGYHTLIASDGETALTVVGQELPDLVILDIVMPGMSGLDVCRALRADPVTAAVPVLIITAAVSPATVAAGHDAGADAYLVKPFNTRDLLTHISHVVRHAEPAG